MKKFLLSFFVFLIFAINITNVEKIYAEELSQVVIYKDNILKKYWDVLVGKKVFNWKELDEDIFEIIVDQNGEIKNELTFERSNDDFYKWKYYLDWKLIGSHNDNIWFLENWETLIFNRSADDNKKISLKLNNEIIFVGNVKEFELFSIKKFFSTKINGWSYYNRTDYIIEKNWNILRTLWHNNWVKFIDNMNENIIYDVVCKDNELKFYYKSKELVDLNNAKKIIFHSERNSILNYFNIDGKSYLLNNKFSIDTEVCSVNIDDKKINVNSDKILKLNNDNIIYELWKEVIYQPNIFRLKNVWNNEIIINNDSNIISKNGIIYNRPLGDTNEKDLAITEEGDILLLYQKNDSIYLVYNFEEIEVIKGENILSSKFVEIENDRLYININWEKKELKEVIKENKELISIPEYKKFIENINPQKIIKAKKIFNISTLKPKDKLKQELLSNTYKFKKINKWSEYLKKINSIVNKSKKSKKVLISVIEKITEVKDNYKDKVDTSSRSVLLILDLFEIKVSLELHKFIEIPKLVNPSWFTNNDKYKFRHIKLTDLLDKKDQTKKNKNFIDNHNNLLMLYNRTIEIDEQKWKEDSIKIKKEEIKKWMQVLINDLAFVNKYYNEKDIDFDIAKIDEYNVLLLPTGSSLNPKIDKYYTKKYYDIFTKIDNIQSDILTHAEVDSFVFEFNELAMKRSEQSRPFYQTLMHDYYKRYDLENIVIFSNVLFDSSDKRLVKFSFRFFEDILDLPKYQDEVSKKIINDHIEKLKSIF